MDLKSSIRPSPIAGVWYSSDASQLTSQLNRFMDQAAGPEIPGTPVAVITPHAGYRYSGRTAGCAFQTLRGMRADIVAVLSPCRDYHTAPASTSAHTAYETALGIVEINRPVVNHLNRLLIENTGRGMAYISNDREHSLEIELPFLQMALSGPFQLLPLMLRNLSPEYLKTVGETLAEVLKGQKALIVASSDLSHFYPEEIANELDAAMLKQIGAFSPEGVLDSERKGVAFACGAPAIAASLWAARVLGADTVRVLHHSTSADQTGDHNSVVGYGAAVVLKTT
ncbi:MAG: AmmeMemoRadiSam system protein B [Anaerolineaceae bacterium]|nr:AmmeMemoRadiSam system protein B [Anaerolineaceae bacterium]